MDKVEYKGPERRQHDRRRGFHKWRWRLITIWIVAFTGVNYYWWQQLQESRVQSCERTYESFNQVFGIFEPSPTTDDFIRLHNEVRRLKAGCTHQTDPTP